MSKYPKVVGQGDPQSLEDDLTHYMESTSRLRGRNAELDGMLKALEEHARHWEAEASQLRADNDELRGDVDRQLRASVRLGQMLYDAEATMREVAEELRVEACGALTGFQRERITALADRLDPPPVVENPPA